MQPAETENANKPGSGRGASITTPINVQLFTFTINNTTHHISRLLELKLWMTDKFRIPLYNTLVFPKAMSYS